MDNHSESEKSTNQKTIEMGTDENGTRNDWTDKHDSEKNPEPLNGSPTMSVTSSESGSCFSSKSDFDFNVGQKIEVRDYRTDMWYLAKIMEVDHDDREIFIHYEKWSQRFDEWMKWDSQRIRRASQTNPSSQFKIGDSVMATWNYTRKYPAVIQNILPDDKYEVKFYDGFVKVIKGNRITELNPNIAQSIMSKLPKDKPLAPPVGSELDVRNIGTKEERREKKRRINVAEIFHPNSAASSAKRRKVDGEVASGVATAAAPSPASAHAQDEVIVTPKERSGGRRSRGGKFVIKEEKVVEVKKTAEKKRRSSRYKEEPKIEDKTNDNDDAKKADEGKDIKMEADDKIESGFEPEKYPLEDELNEDRNAELAKLKDAVVMVEKVVSTDNKRGPDAKDTTSADSKTYVEKELGSETVPASNDNSVPDASTETGPDETKAAAGNEIIAAKTHEKKSVKDVKLKDILPIISLSRTTALRRIRIPKVKTSLGSLTSSSFPKVKITPITKINNRSLTSRGGRVIKKKIPGGGFGESSPAESTPSRASRTTSDADEVDLPNKSDDSDSKDCKLNRGRKTDEDDDPERWNGDVPHGAKPVFIDGGDGKMRQSIIIPDKKLPAGWTKHTIIRKNSSKWDVLLVNPNGRKFRSRKDLRIYYNELNKDYPEDRFDFVVGRTKLTASLIEQATKSNRSPRHVASSPRHVHRSGGKKASSKDLPAHSLASTPASSPVTPPVEEKKIKTLLPKAKSTPLASSNATNFTDEIISPLPAVGMPAASLASAKSSPQTAVTPRAGPLEASHLLATPLSTPLAEEGTGSCQCPKEGCGKNFRKESLLQMHIKHYHPEYSDFLDGALNVADLAYARTVGEQLDGDSSFGGGDGGGGGHGGTGGGHSSFLERITQYEQNKAAAAAAAKANAGGPCHTAGEVAPVTPAAPTSRRRSSGVTGSPAATGGVQSPLRKALMKGLSYSPEHHAEDNVDPNKKSTSLLSNTGTPTGQARPDVGESTPLLSDSDRRTTAADPNDRLKLEDIERAGGDGKDLLQGSHTPPPRQKYLSEGATPDLPKTPSNASYRFARKKPIVSVEKLNVTTDSNGRILLDKKAQDLLKSEISDSAVDSVDLPADAINTTETEVLDVINKKEEIINCPCGFTEEDGLMIQCDLCLCWQHGLCNDISTDSEVPEKYICYICLHSKHSRSSRKYMHNQEWLKDGKLPVLPFRQHNEQDLQQKETLLKRSHELVSTLLQLQTVVQSLRLKTHIAGKSDHPKLYLWSKSWDKDEKDKQELKTEDKEKDDDSKEGEDIKKEVVGTTKKVPNIPVPEAPIDLVECRLRLLEHIENYQQQIDDRLSSLDDQVSALESLDPDLGTDDETDDFYPRSKQTVQMLLNDLGTLRKVTAFN